VNVVAENGGSRLDPRRSIRLTPRGHQLWCDYCEGDGGQILNSAFSSLFAEENLEGYAQWSAAAMALAVGAHSATTGELGRRVLMLAARRRQSDGAASNS
jgi:hypothetical protein